MYIQFALMPGKVNEIRRSANRVRSIQNERERERALAVQSPSTSVGFVHNVINDMMNGT